VSTIALIPARGGSKGLPGKNIIPLAGKPLIAHSIDAARSCAGIERVVVTTDDKAIAAVAREYGAEVVMRPAELATDTASTFDAVVHALNQLPPVETLVLLQPTSPLRTAAHLNAALSAYNAANAPALISVCREEHHPYKSFVLDAAGVLSPLYDRESLSKPRQQLPDVYRQNGAIYIIRTDILLREKHFFVDGTLPFIMDANVSVDVDTANDLAQCEYLLSRA
jgi:CMP-N,N'-diacetyllegionaminic acid synthase